MDAQEHDRIRRRFEERQRELLTPADPAFLKDLPIFSGLPEKKREQIIAERIAKYSSIVEHGPGEVILELGAYNDSAFYVLEGAVEVVVPEAPQMPQVRGGAHVPPAPSPLPEVRGMMGRGQASSTTIVLATLPADMDGGRMVLKEGEIFGELSALSRYQVSATVKAASEVKLLRLQLRGLKNLSSYSKAFKAFLDQRYRARALSTHLKQVELFATLPDSVIASINQKVELLSFEPGEIVAPEGSEADCFYLVRGGYVKVAIRQGASQLAVSYLRKGDYAGQTALFVEQKWPFTLQALENVEVVKLKRADLQEVMELHPELEDALWSEAISALKARAAAARDPAVSEQLQMAMDSGLIHGESVLLIDLDTCTRCDECVRGCADTHGGVPRFVREGERQGRWLVPTACYQCTDPVCMIDCPTGAITREVDSLIVTINDHHHASRPCIGCEGCARRCPWGNIVMVPYAEAAEGKPKHEATKCDLCYTRARGPACVQMCPHGSAVRVAFRDVDKVSELLRR
jgi:CRP-like cAMP-binding protein/Fe-S-cluster-containing dehydrogenase component